MVLGFFILFIKNIKKNKKNYILLLVMFCKAYWQYHCFDIQIKHSEKEI